MARKKKINICQRGKRVERELAAWLKEHGASSAQRSHQYSGNPTDGDSDIRCDELNQFHIECKATKSPVLTKSQLIRWYEQLKVDCPDDSIPVLFTKADGKDWVGVATSPVILLLGVSPAQVISEDSSSINPTKLFADYFQTCAAQEKLLTSSKVYTHLIPALQINEAGVFFYFVEGDYFLKRMLILNQSCL